MSLITNRDGVHFDSQFSPHVRLNFMRHKSSAPNRATLIRYKTTLGFFAHRSHFRQAAEGHIHVQGLAIANELVVQQAVRCFTKTILLIIIYHEIPHARGFFIFPHAQL